MEETFHEEIEKYNEILTEAKNFTEGIDRLNAYILDPITRLNEVVNKLKRDNKIWRFFIPKETSTVLAYAFVNDKESPIKGKPPSNSDTINGTANEVTLTLYTPNGIRYFNGFAWNSGASKAGASIKALDFLRNQYGVDWTFTLKHKKGKYYDIPPIR